MEVSLSLWTGSSNPRKGKEEVTGYTMVRKPDAMGEVIKGRPLMVLSKNETFEIRPNYTLETVLKLTEDKTEAILMECESGDGNTPQEYARQLRETDKDRRHVIKAAWLILEGSQIPNHIVIYWTDDYENTRDLVTWLLQKRGNRSKENPVPRITPYLYTIGFMESPSINPPVVQNGSQELKGK